MNERSQLRTCVIDSDMTIYQAAEVYAQLSLHMDGISELEIDLSLVGEIDCSGLQLLMAAKRECVNRGVTLRLIKHSPAVVNTFEDLNLTAYFNDPLLLTKENTAAKNVNGGETAR